MRGASEIRRLALSYVVLNWQVAMDQLCVVITPHVKVLAGKS